MELTNANLQRFVGGQLEVRYDPNFIYRGEIEEIHLGDDSDHPDLVVGLVWMAAARGDNVCTPLCWVKRDDKDYQTNLRTYVISYEGDKIMLRSSSLGETLILHSPGEDALDPSEVEGL